MGHAIIASGRRPSVQRTARGLGWLSIGVGLAELLAPRVTARAIGIDGAADSRRLLRGFALREIATGVGILSARNPAPWVWARVGGDLIDIATIGSRLQGSPQRQRTGAVLAAIAGVAAADVVCARALEAEGKRRRALTQDYRQRSGLPRPPEYMRGAARQDFVPPTDMQTPRGMRPYVVSDRGDLPR